MDAPIKVFDSGISTFRFQTRNRSIATNINTQFSKYAAFRPDPGAMYIDGFGIDCSDLMF